jgi:hypothetical protein
MLHGLVGPHVWPPHTTSAYGSHAATSRSPRELHAAPHARHTPSRVRVKFARNVAPAWHAVRAWQ